MTLARSSTCNSELRAESSAKPDETGNAYRGCRPLRPPPITPAGPQQSAVEQWIPVSHEEIRKWLTTTATPFSPTVP